MPSQEQAEQYSDLAVTILLIHTSVQMSKLLLIIMWTNQENNHHNN